MRRARGSGGRDGGTVDDYYAASNAMRRQKKRKRVTVDDHNNEGRPRNAAASVGRGREAGVVQVQVRRLVRTGGA
jgi:hypothetical protein